MVNDERDWSELQISKLKKVRLYFLDRETITSLLWILSLTLLYFLKITQGLVSRICTHRGLIFKSCARQVVLFFFSFFFLHMSQTAKTIRYLPIYLVRSKYLNEIFDHNKVIQIEICLNALINPFVHSSYKVVGARSRYGRSSRYTNRLCCVIIVVWIFAFCAFWSRYVHNTLVKYARVKTCNSLCGKWTY